MVRLRAAYRDWTRTIFLRGPDEDYTMSTKGRMLERLRVIMAGRAAEEVCTLSPSFSLSAGGECSCNWRLLTPSKRCWGCFSCLLLILLSMLVLLLPRAVEMFFFGPKMPEVVQ